MTYPVRGFAGGAGLAAMPAVLITTTGSTFAPQVQVASPQAVTVTWTWPGGSSTGLSPSINFGSPATRTVAMTATMGASTPALSQITTFNLGYVYANDTGNFSPPATYNLAGQGVAGLAGINLMTGLQLFFAGEMTTLMGPADFTGMTQLTNIECYGSRLTSFNVAGCSSLQRLVVENNNLTTANINPVMGTLREVRLANQVGGSLTFSPAVSGTATVDYHWCFRDQTVTNMPSLASTLPVVKELWIWNTGQSGALAPASTVLNNVQAFSNSYTSANFTSLFVTGSTGYLDLHSNSLATCTLTGCTSIGYLDLSNNLLPQAQVDAVLAVLAASSVSNGTCNVGGTGNAAPSGAGLTSASTLTGRGWTVTHN